MTDLRSNRLFARLFVLGSLSLSALSACGPGTDAQVFSAELQSADETAAVESALSGNFDIGTELVTKADLNLRSGPGISHSVLTVMPEGKLVTVVAERPSGNFYRIKYGNRTGWSSGKYLKRKVSEYAGAQGLKVMQFNILTGGTGKLSNGKARVDALAAIIRREAPDLVSINEAINAEMFETLAKKVGMDSKLCRARNGWNVGLLSTRPFVATHCAAPSPVTKVIAIGGVAYQGRTVYALSAHLVPRSWGSESLRASEMRAVLAQARELGSHPTIIMGDFNSDSPEDGKSGGVTPVLTRAGFVDAFRSANSNAKSNFGRTMVDSSRRIDYIFHDKDFRSVSAKVLNADRPWPSDHYAVTATLQLQ